MGDLVCKRKGLQGTTEKQNVWGSLDLRGVCVRMQDFTRACLAVWKKGMGTAMRRPSCVGVRRSR